MAYIKVDGEWKRATPFVKVDGVWKQASPYIKVAGTWKNVGEIAIPFMASCVHQERNVTQFSSDKVNWGNPQYGSITSTWDYKTPENHYRWGHKYGNISITGVPGGYQKTAKQERWMVSIVPTWPSGIPQQIIFKFSIKGRAADAANLFIKNKTSDNLHNLSCANNPNISLCLTEAEIVDAIMAGTYQVDITSLLGENPQSMGDMANGILLEVFMRPSSRYIDIDNFEIIVR